jgi:hypothetical protein
MLLTSCDLSEAISPFGHYKASHLPAQQLCQASDSVLASKHLKISRRLVDPLRSRAKCSCLDAKRNRL